MIDLPIDIINPGMESRTRRYAESAETITPWFDANEPELDKVALRIKAECSQMSATKTIEIEYALDNSDVWTSISTLEEDGQHVFDLAPSPNADDLSGILFREIRFRITSASDTAEESPDLHNLSLEFLKELDEQWQFRFSVDLNKTYNGLTPDEMREKLLESQNKRHLVPFTYRNKDGASVKFHVNMQRPQFLEYEGGAGEYNANALIDLVAFTEPEEF